MTRPKPGVLNDRMDWNLLRTFLIIVQERSVSQAATRLHLTQPAVSQALKRLEQQLDAQLIYRRGSVFRLTALGEEVYRIAGDIYGNISRLDGVLESRRDDASGTLRLLVISRIESALFDEFLADFHRVYPRVELDVEVMRSADILNALLQKTTALGFSLCRNPLDRLERELFMRQRYALFCGRHHHLFGRRGLGMQDLLAENFVSFTSDQIGDSLSPLTIFRDQSGFTGRIVATSSSIEEIRRLVFTGYGLGCLPEHIVRDDIEAGRLWRLPPEEGVADVDVFLVWHRERRLTAAERVFVENFRRFMARVPLTMRLGESGGR